MGVGGLEYCQGGLCMRSYEAGGALGEGGEEGLLKGSVFALDCHRVLCYGMVHKRSRWCTQRRWRSWKDVQCSGLRRLQNVVY